MVLSQAPAGLIWATSKDPMPLASLGGWWDTFCSRNLGRFISSTRCVNSQSFLMTLHFKTLFLKNLYF